MTNQMIDNIYNMDCFEGMKAIPDESIDMVLCDLPYNTTDSSWDKKAIDLDKLWSAYKRITTSNAAIVLFASGMFTAKLIASNVDMYKYKYTWIKNCKSLFIQSKVRPLTQHEDILIFSKGTAANKAKNNMVYNPQGLIPCYEQDTNNKTRFTIYGDRPSHQRWDGIRHYKNYPTDVLYYDCVTNNERIHSNQKPLALCEFLIKTYTNEGHVVLDNCMGSGTTAVACKNTGRHFIGYELDKVYCDAALRRLHTEQGNLIQ